MNIAAGADWDVRIFDSYEALVFGEQTFTNVALHEYASRLASALLERDVKPGSMIVTQLDPGAEFVIALEGVLRAGCVFVPLSPKTPAALRERIADRCDAAALIASGTAVARGTGADEQSRFCILVDRGPAGRTEAVDFWNVIATHRALRRPVERQADDLAVVNFSSGTTGVPKGVVRTHGGLNGAIAAGRGFAGRSFRARQWGRERLEALTDRVRPPGERRPVPTTIIALPLTHLYGTGRLLARMFSKSRVVVMERFEPHAVLSAIARYRIPELDLVPSHAEELLASASSWPRYDLSSLRRITVGGAPSRNGLLEALSTGLGVAVHNRYGMTEGGATSTSFSPRAKPGSVGRPVPGTRVRIVNEQGEVLSAGQVGEVEFRTQSPFAGYFGDAEATSAVRHDEWRRTGDLGYCDGDGDLFLVGRKDDLIIQGGINIVPGDVEHVLCSMPGIAEAAVVGITHSYLGQQMVACVVAAPGATTSVDAIMAECRRLLDGDKIPAAVRFVESLPKTETGKLKRRALRETLEAEVHEPRDTPFVHSLASLTRDRQREALHRAVGERVSQIRGAGQDQRPVIDAALPLLDQGMTSLDLVRLVNTLSELVGHPIDATAAFNHPTVDALSGFLTEVLFGAQPQEVTPSAGAAAPADAIAIVGMGCRFPGGVTDARTYWSLLYQGIDATQALTSGRFAAAARDQSGFGGSGRPYTQRASLVDDIDRFDAEFFAVSPIEAARLPAALRMFLEVAWEAIEHAGQSPDALAAGHTGVYVGAMGGGAQIAGLVSHCLNLHGPSIVLDTACSSSLVAIHLAVEALRRGECDVALGGGVQVLEWRALIGDGATRQLLAPDGRCKTFDAAANGIGLGEGCGVVVLKRLQDALADRDAIVAVIRGSAVNHDGRSASPTAPNGVAQRRLIEAALSVAAIDPSHVDYLEAHGTGTSLGDPIEVQAAVEALGTTSRHPLAIGSVKTNIGHTLGAAGVAGLIKAALCVDHAAIPPHLHITSMNPALTRWAGALDIPTQVRTWPDTAGRRRIAGVTSMGLYGTNAHVVIEEAPPPSTREQAMALESPYVLCLSARTAPALQEQARRLHRALGGMSEDGFADVCYTAAVGRRHFSHRLALIVPNLDAARDGLAEYAATGATRGGLSAIVKGRPRIAFLFTGQGSQYVEMGRQLWDGEPVFRDALMRCDRVLGPLLSRSIVDVLYPAGAAAAEADAAMVETWLAQPLVFSVEWALSELWRSWGVTPDVVVGHSLGEYVAVCVAGAVELETALHWVAERARLMQALPRGGAMASITASEARVSAALRDAGGDVTIAGINGRKNTVIAGGQDAVDLVCRVLKQEGVECQRLKVSHAFHSSSMDPILDDFTRASARVTFTEPRIAVISSVTGKRVTIAELSDARYWRRQLRDPVQFSSAIATCLADGVREFVEVGPHPALLGLARADVDESGDYGWWPSLRRQRSARAQFVESLGHLYARGASPDWSAFYARAAVRRVRLPAYPFDYTGRRWEPASDLAVSPERTPLVDMGHRVGTPMATGFVETLHERLRACTFEQRVEIVQEWLRRELASCIGSDADSLGEESNLLTAGLDSLRIVELLSLVRRDLQVICAPPDLVAHPTLAHFSTYVARRLVDPVVEARGQEQSDLAARSGAVRHSSDMRSRTPMIVVNEHGTGAPLIGCHPSGGQVTCYVRLFGLLGAERPLYAIQSRAVDDPAREHDSLESMAIDYATLIQASGDGPYCLFGWSMGGVIGHAVAGELERRGERVASVMMIDPPRGATASGHPVSGDGVSALYGTLHELNPRGAEGAGESISARMLSALEHEDVGEIFTWCVRENLLPSDTAVQARFEASLILQRRHHGLLRRYRASPIESPVEIWWAGTIPSELAGFRTYSETGVRHHVLAATHFSMLLPPALDSIAGALRAAGEVGC